MSRSWKCWSKRKQKMMTRPVTTIKECDIVLEDSEEDQEEEVDPDDTT